MRAFIPAAIPSLPSRPSLFGLNEHGAFRLWHRVLHKNAETFGNLRIGLDQSAEIFAEAILVQLVLGFDVPKAAAVGADFVSEHYPHLVVLENTPEFHLEVDKPDADAEEEASEKIVDSECKRHHLVDLLRGSPAEGRDVLLRNHRIVQLVGLVIELDDRARQRHALFKPQPLAQRARDHVAHHNLKRNNFHFPDKLLAHIETANEMGGHADFVQAAENIFRNAVVQHTLALEALEFLGVEGGGVVFEMLDERAGLGAFIKNFRLSFIDATAAVVIHGRPPSVEGNREIG